MTAATKTIEDSFDEGRGLRTMDTITSGYGALPKLPFTIKIFG